MNLTKNAANFFPMFHAEPEISFASSQPELFANHHLGRPFSSHAIRYVCKKRKQQKRGKHLSVIAARRLRVETRACILIARASPRFSAPTRHNRAEPSREEKSSRARIAAISPRFSSSSRGYQRRYRARRRRRRRQRRMLGERLDIPRDPLGKFGIN